MITLENIQLLIFFVRGERVMFDFHLAEMYNVETRTLKQAVRRNPDRFPPDFMFQLSKEEFQEVITVCDNLPQTLNTVLPLLLPLQNKSGDVVFCTKKSGSK